MLINRLAILLAERKMSGTRLFTETGIAQSTISKITSNKSKQIDYETVNKICNALGVTPADFFDYSPIDYEIILDDYKETLFEWVLNVLVKISERNRHVATLEYKADFTFSASDSHLFFDGDIINGISIEDIYRHAGEIRALAVTVKLNKIATDRYDNFFDLPSNFQSIFDSELAPMVSDCVKKNLEEEFDFFFDYIEKSHTKLTRIGTSFEVDVIFIISPSASARLHTDNTKKAKESPTTPFD